jgi:hypothetical protein
MAAGDQIGAQFPVVVDFSVEDHPNRPVFVTHGLVAGTQIDDAEPAHADGATAFDMEPLVIGAAMADLVAHGLDEWVFRFSIEQDEAGDSAHLGSKNLYWFECSIPAPPHARLLR